MRWIVLMLSMGCSPCPEGMERVEGLCQPEGGFEPVPLSEDNFPDRYESTGCRTLEGCLCDDLESDFMDCDVECEPVDWSWTAGCAFDLEAAEACLSEPWVCHEESWSVEAPAICEVVYACGDTGA